MGGHSRLSTGPFAGSTALRLGRSGQWKLWWDLNGTRFFEWPGTEVPFRGAELRFEGGAPLPATDEQSGKHPSHRRMKYKFPQTVRLERNGDKESPTCTQMHHHDQAWIRTSLVPQMEDGQSPQQRLHEDLRAPDRGPHGRSHAHYVVREMAKARRDKEPYSTPGLWRCTACAFHGPPGSGICSRSPGQDFTGSAFQLHPAPAPRRP